MKTIKTILAVLGVGALLMTAGPAAAGVGISVGFSSGQIGAQMVIARPAPVMAVAAPVYAAAPQPAVVALANDYAYGPFSGYAGQARYFQIYVPAGQTYMTIVTDGSLGDSNLLAAQGYWPTPNNATLASFNDGTSERIEVLYPTPGVWNIVVYGNSAFSNVSILASFWQQDTYLPTYTTYDTYPAGRTNVLVRIAWGSAGCERQYGGWIPFIRHRIAEPRTEQRRPVVVAPRVEDRRPVAVAPRVEERKQVAVAPRVGQSRPEQRTTVTPRASTAPRPMVAPQPTVRQGNGTDRSRSVATPSAQGRAERRR